MDHADLIINLLGSAMHEIFLEQESRTIRSETTLLDSIEIPRINPEIKAVKRGGANIVDTVSDVITVAWCPIQ